MIAHSTIPNLRQYPPFHVSLDSDARNGPFHERHVPIAGFGHIHHRVAKIDKNSCHSVDSQGVAPGKRMNSFATSKWPSLKPIVSLSLELTQW